MFSIEQIYRCSRVDYCRLSGITPVDMITSLSAEVSMLERSLELYRNEYRDGGSITLDSQKERASIIYAIQDKMDKKRHKIKDICKEFFLKE